jgi:hypothetical protein
MSPWIYDNEEMLDISQFPQNTYGFVYRINHLPTDKSYIGKKVLFHNRKTKLGKKELAQYEGMVGRKPSFKMVTKESNWKKYYGSNKSLLELVKKEPLQNFRRDILILAPTKKLLTYQEIKFLFVFRVLEEPEMYFNDNIQGKFFRKDFDI